MSRLDLGDVCLNVEVTGAGQPLVLLHGFTGNAELWADDAAMLADVFRVLAVDLLGHGKSDAPKNASRYCLERCVEDLEAVLDALGIERAHCLGYSMGGRVALAFALARPGRVGRLILEGASPGIADPVERRQRRARDQALALMIERDGVEAFVAEWLRQPLFATQRRLAEDKRTRQRSLRLKNAPLGLANSLRGAGAGAQRSYWDRLGELATPTLLVVGEQDDKFLTIARDMAACMQHAELAVIPGAGHAAHLEDPTEFWRRVIGFLTAEGARRPAAGVQ